MNHLTNPERHRKQSISLYRAYLMVGAVGVVMLAFILVNYINAKRLNERTSPLWTAIREVKLEAAAVQHEGSDLLRGEIDPAADRLWLHMDQLIRQLKNLLKPYQQNSRYRLFRGKLDAGECMESIDDYLAQLKAFFQEHKERVQATGLNAVMIVRFDELFAAFRSQLDELESETSDLMVGEQLLQNISYAVMVVFCVAMTILVTFQIRRYERYRKESFETLNQANIQLAGHIADRERVEASLKESELLSRTIFETSPDAIILSRTADNVIVDVNRGFTELTGYEKDEVVGKTPGDIPRWKDFNIRDSYVAALGAGRPVHNIEFQVHTKHESIKTTLVSANTVNFGQSAHLIAVARDISELKAVEKDLRRSEEKFRGLFESASDFIHILDVDGTILQSNSAAIGLLGLSMAELRQRRISDFVDEASRPHLETMVTQVTQKGRFNVECTIEAANGVTMTVDCSAFPVRNSQGHTDFVVIFQKDITARKQAEQQLRVSYEFTNISNENRNMKNMLTKFIAAINAQTGCRACFIRLIGDHGNIYDAAACDAEARPCELDNQYLKSNRSMCAQVLNNGADADLPWFTDFGSYFSDAAVKDGEGAAEGPRCERPNRCIRAQYSSLALVPIRVGNQILGLIQIADTRAGMLNRIMVELMETAAMHVGAAIRRLRAEEGLETAYHELENRVVERTQALSDMNRELQIEIAERRQVEDRLRKNRNTLQTLIDGIGDSLILVDKEMKIRMLNRMAAETYHIDSLDHVIGKLCHQKIAPAGSCSDCVIPRAVQRGENYTFERQGLVDPERLERITIYPVTEGETTSAGAIIRIRDVTEEKRLEQQLVRSEKMASLGILVSSIGHEINNPNNFIIFNIPILREYLEALVRISDQHAATQPDFELFHMSYGEFRDDVFKLVDNIEHGASRICHFVSNLREFSQNNGNREKIWLELPMVIDKVLSICRSQINKRIRDFRIEIPADQPKVYADEYSLEQVLLNLIVNAIQAADKVDTKVSIAASTGATWLDNTIIAVSDNGCGIDQGKLEKIFNPFFTTKSASEGTGLGLYVCHNLVQRLGGRVEVVSKVGEGSTFTIFLPDTDRRLKARG